MVESIWMWIGFLALIGVLLALDLGVFNRGNKHISVRKALELTAFWIIISLIFGIFIYFELGANSATEYYAAYVVEKAMSVDNIFVFIIIFSYFKIPEDSQHKALFYGVVGAIVFRFIFIVIGVELINRFDWMMIIFGILLMYLAIKTVVQKDKDESKTADNMIVRFFKKFMNVCDECDKEKLFTVKNGVRMATPLFLAIIALESTDIIFALDSVPAVLAITQDTFIAYTSNIFAILGMRSLYFALRGVANQLEYLKYGLGFILGFVGVKMLISEWYHVSVAVSLVVILGALAVTILVSLYAAKKKKPAQPAGPAV